MQLLSVTQVAELLGVSAATVRRMIRDNEIPSIRVGRSIRVKQETLETWIDGIETKGGE